MRIFRRLARFQNEFFSIWRVLLVPRINFFQLGASSRTSLSKDEAWRDCGEYRKAAGACAEAETGRQRRASKYKIALPISQTRLA
jgi:hypothetical protein